MRGDTSLQNCSKNDTRHDDDVQIYNGTLCFITLGAETQRFQGASLFVVLLMLGVVLADPEIPLEAALVPPPSPPSVSPVFTDEKKSKVSMCRDTKPLSTPDVIKLRVSLNVCLVWTTMHLLTLKGLISGV